MAGFSFAAPASPAAARQQAYRRASQSRFRNLLNNRIGKAQGMRKVLGDKQWAMFVHNARLYGKPMFLKEVTPTNVRCHGPIETSDVCATRSTAGTQDPDTVRSKALRPGLCPHNNDTGMPELSRIHCDHTTDLNAICTAWKAARARVLAAHTRTGTTPALAWGVGIVKPALLRMLFGLGTPHLVFRCDRCHSKQPHYSESHKTAAFIATHGSKANPIILE